MPQEIYWLALTAIFTSIMWVPYTLTFIIERGFLNAIMDGNGTAPPQTPWALRLKKAHANTVENLVIFAPLAISVVVLDMGNELTAMMAMTFFFSRVAFAVIYALGIPVLRTLVFSVGIMAQIGLALVILGVL